MLSTEQKVRSEILIVRLVMMERSRQGPRLQVVESVLVASVLVVAMVVAMVVETIRMSCL